MRPVMTMKPIHDSNGRLLNGFEDVGVGKFHGWGVEYEEFENGPGNYSVAIIEMPDGTMQTLVPWLVRFLDGEVAAALASDYALDNPLNC